MPLGEDPAVGPQEERDNLNALTARATRAQIRRCRVTCRQRSGSKAATQQPNPAPQLQPAQFAGVEQAACQRAGEMEASELNSQPFVAP